MSGKSEVEKVLIAAGLAQPRPPAVVGQLTEAERERLAGNWQGVSDAILEERFPRRWRDPEVVQRAMLAEVPLRLLFDELTRRTLAILDSLWRRALAWVTWNR